MSVGLLLYINMCVRKKRKRHNHGYCKLAVGQSVPEGGEMIQPCGAYPEGVRGVGYRNFSLISSLAEGQQHPSCESITLWGSNASKCWPPSGPIWVDGCAQPSRHAPLRGTRREVNSLRPLWGRPGLRPATPCFTFKNPSPYNDKYPL